MSNNSVIRPKVPLFGLNELAYARSSALKGYIEPLKIIAIEYSPSNQQYVYSFSITSNPNPSKSELMPIKLLENELITLCEALTIQISVLTKQYNDNNTLLLANCPEDKTQPDVPPVSKSGYISRLSAPRFGVNEVVYLKDTAQSVGRLEAYKLNGAIKFESKIEQWLYTVHIRKQFLSTMTIGDRDDMRRAYVLDFPESELMTLCEALPLVVAYLKKALDKAVANKTRYCS